MGVSHTAGEENGPGGEVLVLDVMTAKPASSIQPRWLCWINFPFQGWILLLKWLFTSLIALVTTQARQRLPQKKKIPAIDPESCHSHTFVSVFYICLFLCFPSASRAGCITDRNGSPGLEHRAAAQASTVCDLWPHRSSNWTHLWDLQKTNKNFYVGNKMELYFLNVWIYFLAGFFL